MNNQIVPCRPDQRVKQILMRLSAEDQIIGAKGHYLWFKGRRQQRIGDAERS